MKARVIRFLRKCAAVLDAVLTEILIHIRSNMGEREFDQAMQKIVHYVGFAIGIGLTIMVIVLVAVVWQWLDIPLCLSASTDPRCD